MPTESLICAFAPCLLGGGRTCFLMPQNKPGDIQRRVDKWYVTSCLQPLFPTLFLWTLPTTRWILMLPYKLSSRALALKRLVFSVARVHHRSRTLPFAFSGGICRDLGLSGLADCPCALPFHPLSPHLLHPCHTFSCGWVMSQPVDVSAGGRSNTGKGDVGTTGQSVERCAWDAALPCWLANLLLHVLSVSRGRSVKQVSSLSSSWGATSAV